MHQFVYLYYLLPRGFYFRIREKPYTDARAVFACSALLTNKRCSDLSIRVITGFDQRNLEILRVSQDARTDQYHASINRFVYISFSD